MAWIIAILVLIAAVAFPAFRKVLLVLITVCIVLIGIFYLRNQAEEEASKKRLLPSDIELVDLRLVPGYGPESYRLVGRVRNKSSRYTLSDLRIKVIMRDCSESGACETVGESVAWTFNDVPAQQARDIDESVYFNGLGPARGRREWDWSIQEIRGE